MMKDTLAGKLIDHFKGKFSKELGIDLSTPNPKQVFRWFLAAKLFGARISSNTAIKTYREFERRGAVSPGAILAAGWDGLVRILDDGGYARYDFSTATKLLEIMNDLEKLYGGDLNRLHDKAADEKDLEGRLKDLGKGIGAVTVNIFLRELRPVWKKARPGLSELVLLAAGDLGLIRPNEDPLKTLEDYWKKNKTKGNDFCDFEAAILRLGKDYCKKGRSGECPFRDRHKA